MEMNVSMKQYRAFADCYFLSLRASAHTGVAIHIPNGGLNLSIFQRERIATPVTSVTGSQ